MDKRKRVSSQSTDDIRKEKTLKRIIKQNPDWKKAMAVPYTKEEEQEIITGKLRDRIHRQNDYREGFLKRLVKQARLEHINRLIDEANTAFKDEVVWLGISYPVSILMAEYNLELHYYKIALMNEKYLYKALRNDGLSDEDIKLVQAGNYIKDERNLDDETINYKEIA